MSVTRWTLCAAAAVMICTLLTVAAASGALLHLAFAPTPPEYAAASYRTLDALFRACNRSNVTAFVSDGTLLSAKRFGMLAPWDHDLEIRIADPRDAAAFDEQVAPALDRAVPHWRDHVELDSPGYADIGGCGVNELMARGEYRLIVTKVARQLRGLDGLPECERRRAAEGRATAPSAAVPVEAVTLEHPAGHSARVAVPRDWRPFLSKYGDGMTECVPDVRRRVVWWDRGQLRSGQAINYWAFVHMAVRGPVPCWRDGQRLTVGRWDYPL